MPYTSTPSLADAGQSVKSDAQRAATVQALWRGQHARQQHKVPRTAHATAHATYVVGNEPDFTSNIKFEGHFALVGTSAMRILKIAMELAASPEKSTGYEHTPKLFLVDNSANVVEFWALMKKAFSDAQDIKAFWGKMRASKHLINAVSLQYDCQNDNIYRMLILMCHMTGDNPRDLSGGSQARFLFLKTAVEKMTVICHDWANPDVFKYIRDKIDPHVPVMVYPSNIWECSSPSSASNKFDIPDRIVQNYLQLRPTLTIHTRTSQDYHDSTRSIMPQAHVPVFGADPLQHHLALRNPEFWNLMKPMSPFWALASFVAAAAFVYFIATVAAPAAYQMWQGDVNDLPLPVGDNGPLNQTGITLPPPLSSQLKR